MRGDAHDAARRLAQACAALARIGAPAPACVRDRAFVRLAARLAASPTPEHREIATALGRALTARDMDAALALASTAGRRADRRAEKIVSRRYRFVWIGNPKAASRSLVRALLAADPEAQLIRRRTLDELLDRRPALAEYFSFAFVRHPVSRTRSFHADKHGLAAHDRSARRWFIDPWHGLACGMGFAEVCRWLATPAGADAFADRHWLSQHAQIRTLDGRAPDFVGRFETLDADWRRVVAHTGMPWRPLPRLNARAARAADDPEDAGSRGAAAAALRRGLPALGLCAVTRGGLRARRAGAWRRRLPPGPAMRSREALLLVLRGAVLAGVALVLLTPFVVMPEVFHAHAVGKAVWSRALIAVLFALWAALALLDPAARPPRSPLLAVLGLGAGVALLAAAAGVDPGRSLWSSYERMQGVVDLLHWLAFFTVLVSVLRTARAWRRVLALNLAAGTALVLLVIARSLDVDVPFWGDLPEHRRRFGGPLGNPVVLGAYLSVNAVMALGFAAAAARGRDAGGGAPAGAWAAVSALQLWGLALAGSAGAFAGLLAGLVVAGAGLALLARRRRAVWVAAGALAVAVGGGLAVLGAGGAVAEWVHRPGVQLLDKLDPAHPTVQGRLAAWRMSLAGLAERPLLGWGPENFDAVFGRFATGYGAAMEAHDRPHGTVFEAMATTGAAGLAAWLALWAATFAAAWRAVRERAGAIRLLALFTGAALAAHLVQGLAFFDTASSRMQHMLLLAFLATLAGPGRAASPRLAAAGAAVLAGAASLRARAARGVLFAAALGLAGAGLASTLAIHGAARDLQTGIAKGSFMENFRRAVEGFEPLAGEPRRLLFANALPHWEELHRSRPGAAAAFAALVAREADAALGGRAAELAGAARARAPLRPGGGVRPGIRAGGARASRAREGARPEPRHPGDRPGAAVGAGGPAPGGRARRTPLAGRGGGRLPLRAGDDCGRRPPGAALQLRRLADRLCAAARRRTRSPALRRQGVQLSGPLQRLGKVAARPGRGRAAVTASLHLAFVMPHFGRGGAETSMRSLARGLMARGHRVDLLTVGRSAEPAVDLPPDVRLLELDPRRTFRPGERPRFLDTLAARRG